MDLEKMIAERVARLAGLVAQRAALSTEGAGILAGAEADAKRALTEAEDARALAIVGQRASIGAEIDQVEKELVDLRAAEARDKVDAAAASNTKRLLATPGLQVGAEARTYTRETDKTGKNFALDVARSFLFGDMQAQQRLSRHMQEEISERGDVIARTERAAGTGAFTGLVVPQYLTDQYAPAAKAGRPLADAARHHDLPEQGMTVSIGKTTTGTSVANQSAENATVSETDIDDTLITLPILTAAGSQTISRQAIERGAGVEDTVIDDLIRGFAVNLDSNLINQASTGLTNVATSIAYTDATPTAPELYPKLLQGPAQVEAALLDQALGDTIAVMHSRRWYWLQSQLTSTWPLFGQPGVAGQFGGENYGQRYGAGFRGILPSGTPVIVDNSISTALGAGTEDEIYFIAQSEAHLWEDPDAPLLIRAEQPSAKKLGVDLVVYGYYAYTFTRRTHAQKINGTGLIAPTF